MFEKCQMKKRVSILFGSQVRKADWENWCDKFFCMVSGKGIKNYW